MSNLQKSWAAKQNLNDVKPWENLSNQNSFKDYAKLLEYPLRLRHRHNPFIP